MNTPTNNGYGSSSESSWIPNLNLGSEACEKDFPTSSPDIGDPNLVLVQLLSRFLTVKVSFRCGEAVDAVGLLWGPVWMNLSMIV